MTVTDDLLRNNAEFAKSFSRGDLPMPPGKALAVVACMDARLNVQHLLGTKEIILVHHTDCGMLTFTDDQVKADIEAATGLRPHFALEAFSDLERDIRQSIARIRHSPFVLHKDSIRGFIYDVTTGQLQEVT